MLRRLEDNTWESVVKPAKSVRIGSHVDITNDKNEILGRVNIIKTGEEGIRFVQFQDEKIIYKAGEMPLPPYIHKHLENGERYQTVYARNEGSAAAPTAGLHFTGELLESIKRQGVICAPVTLHIGLDTFQPVRVDDPEKHIIHREFGIINNETAYQISLAKKERRRVICVGTTSTRIIEHAFHQGLTPSGFSGWVDLFILPGFQFRVTDALITNFHLPRTTLIMLVSAFAGKELIDRSYTEAINEKYRFYSFGDAMFIV